METSEVKKTPKASKKSSSSAIRVSQETRKRLLAELSRINKKPHGKRVKIDALLCVLLPKLTAKDVSELQNASLSGRDRLEQLFARPVTGFAYPFGELCGAGVAYKLAWRMATTARTHRASSRVRRWRYTSLGTSGCR